MAGQRQLVALASSAASGGAADGPRPVTVQEVEARDPTIAIAAQLQQKQCVHVSYPFPARLPQVLAHHTDRRLTSQNDVTQAPCWTPSPRSTCLHTTMYSVHGGSSNAKG